MATNSLIHYALDLESPPLIACEHPEPTHWSTVAAEVTCPDCMTYEEFPRGAVGLIPRQLTTRVVLTDAASLIGGDGTSPEYERAIVELTTLLIGASLQDDTDLVTHILRAFAEGK